MKILVTGADGMLGSALCPELARRGHEVRPTDRRPLAPGTHPLDVCDAEAVSRLIAAAAPDWVMHLAAETDVDRCEREPETAYRTNAAGTEHVVRACRQAGARLVYISTAGVFDGQKPSPYHEGDVPNPINVYGRSKLAGETAVRQYEGVSLTVRAGWMVGGLERDKKFVWKILQRLERDEAVPVVTDKIGSLTFTEDLSRGLAALIETRHTGLFHMANRGVCSRYDIACKLVDYLGRQGVVIQPVTSEAFPLPAPRSPSEAMENRRLDELGLDLMPSWEEALRVYVEHYRQLAGRTQPAAPVKE